MKKVKIGLGVFLTVVLIGSFFFSTVHAQVVPYTIWEGAWFKINVVVKGYERNLGGTPNWLPNNGRFTAFVHVGTWNDPNGSIAGDETFAAEIHTYDEDTGWQIMPVFLHRIHGNAQDFIIWSNYIKGDVATGTGETIRFIARITGRMDKDGIFMQTGTFKSLAGSHIKMDPLDPLGPMYEASGLALTGNLIIHDTFCKSKTNLQYPPCF